MSKKHLNPDASKTNVLQISKSDAGCKDCVTKVCESTVSNAEGETLTVVQIEGAEPYVLEAPATTLEEKQAAIKAAIKAAGYIQINPVNIEVVDGVEAITHTGEAHIESLTYGAEPVDGEVLCLAKYICDYQADGTGLLVFSWNGTDYEIGEFVAGTNTPEEVLAGLEAVIAANPELAFIENPVVTLNETGTAFTVQYSSCQPQCGTVHLGEREFFACVCETRYFTTGEEEKVKAKILRKLATDKKTKAKK